MMRKYLCNLGLPSCGSGGGCGEVEVGGGEVQGGGKILQIEKHSQRVQMCLYTLWRLYEVIQRELSTRASTSIL